MAKNTRDVCSSVGFVVIIAIGILLLLIYFNGNHENFINGYGYNMFWSNKKNQEDHDLPDDQPQELEDSIYCDSCSSSNN